jgi:hypothetical protein
LPDFPTVRRFGQCATAAAAFLPLETPPRTLDPGPHPILSACLPAELDSRRRIDPSRRLGEKQTMRAFLAILCGFAFTLAVFGSAFAFAT